VQLLSMLSSLDPRIMLKFVLQGNCDLCCLLRTYIWKNKVYLWDQLDM